MIRRLSYFDLPGRLERYAPVPVVQFAVGLGLAGVALGARALIETLAPGVVPFALLFPAILVATGIAGWTAGVVALLSGGLISWYFLLPPLGSFAIDAARAANLALYTVSGALVIAAAAAYRSTALALRESEERLELATAAAQVGVWEWRPETGEIFFSQEARWIYGFAPGQAITPEMVRSAIHPGDRPPAGSPGEDSADPALADGGRHEFRVVRPNGEVRWVYALGRVVSEPVGARRGAKSYVGALLDITERRANEERVQLLAREIDHRANNLLAVVQGTVALSQADDPATLKKVIGGRINALARAHQLLAAARWEGADLRSLVSEELLAYSLGDESRAVVSGPRVSLTPAAAQSLAMALHELATNAAKYGAFSVSSGRVEVTWTLDAAGDLDLSWRETGGPEVRPPTRKGFGASLLPRALSGGVGGKVQLDWRPEGLCCAFKLPARSLDATEPRPPSVR